MVLRLSPLLRYSVLFRDSGAEGLLRGVLCPGAQGPGSWPQPRGEEINRTRNKGRIPLVEAKPAANRNLPSAVPQVAGCRNTDYFI